MARYLLTPGACHGGWWFEPVVRQLHDAGHSAHAVTLSGLDPNGSPAPAANLRTHIDEVSSLLTGHDQSVVLVGHSYAGSVITGVADQHPTRIAALVYIDAFVPSDGDSCWSMTNDEQRQWYGDGSGRTGLAVEPLPFFDERARPHPLGTLMQASTLTAAWKTVPRKGYVAAVGEEWTPHSPFVRFAEGLRADQSWTVFDVDTGHDVLKEGPDQLTEILLRFS